MDQCVLCEVDLAHFRCVNGHGICNDSYCRICDELPYDKAPTCPICRGCYDASIFTVDADAVQMYESLKHTSLIDIAINRRPDYDHTIMSVYVILYVLRDIVDNMERYIVMVPTILKKYVDGLDDKNREHIIKCIADTARQMFASYTTVQLKFELHTYLQYAILSIL